MSATAREALRIDALRFAWRGGRPLFNGLSLVVGAGERCLVHGPSGSGKSTLLNLIGGTLHPDAGSIDVGGARISHAPEHERDRLRADHVGIIFQQFNLLPFLSVRDNVLLPCRFSRRRRDHALLIDASLDAAASRLLERLGLGHPGLADRPAGELSVGQQQRVAAARALIGTPELVLADEPTSALDADARSRFLDLLFEQSRHAGAAVLLVSHDVGMRTRFDRALDLRELRALEPQA